MPGLHLRNARDFCAIWIDRCVFMLLLFAQFPLANANSPSAVRLVADATRNLSLYSNAALVLDENTGAVLYGKNMDTVHPIASLPS